MLKTGFDGVCSASRFYVECPVMSAVWGLLRWQSGSVIVSSVSHGVWKTQPMCSLVSDRKVGPLGIKNTGFFGPGIGVLGLALNVAFVATLWR